jgi:Prp8 binding protein
MELSGHSGEVFSAKFDPSGNYAASGSMDRSICMSYDRREMQETPAD